MWGEKEKSLPTKVVPNKKPIKPPLKPPTGLLTLAIGSTITGSLIGKGGGGGIKLGGGGVVDSNNSTLLGSAISSSCCMNLSLFLGNDSSNGGNAVGLCAIGSGSFKGGKAIFERCAGFFSPFNIVVDVGGVGVVEYDLLDVNLSRFSLIFNLCCIALKRESKRF